MLELFIMSFTSLLAPFLPSPRVADVDNLAAGEMRSLDGVQDEYSPILIRFSNG